MRMLPRRDSLLRTRARALAALLVLAGCGGGGSSPGGGVSAEVRVDATQVTGHIDRHLWGTQILWTGPSNGLPDKVTTPEAAAEVRAKFFSYAPLVRDMGPTVLRYPGGLLSNHYDWRDGLGPMEARPVDPTSGRNIVVGSDEFGQFCEQIGAVGMITVNWALGPGTAADWVEYMNSPNDGSNPRGGTDWAAVRATNGHPAPYDVRFWEIGNELRGGDFFINLYATSLMSFRVEMEKVDPTIEIGAIGFGTYYEPEFTQQWYSTINSLAPDGFDFWAKHLYAPSSLSPNYGFEITKPGITVSDTPTFPANATYTFAFSIVNASGSGEVPTVDFLVDGAVNQTFTIAGNESPKPQVALSKGPHTIGLRLTSKGVVRVYHEIAATAPFVATTTVDLKNDPGVHDVIMAGFDSLETFLFEPAGTLGDHAVYGTENNTVYNFQEAKTRHVHLREALSLADLFNVLVRNGIPVSTTFLLYEEDNGLGQIQGVSRWSKTGESGSDNPRPRPTYWVQKLFSDYLDEGDRLKWELTTPTFDVGFEAGLSMGFVSSLVTRVDTVAVVAGRSPEGDRLTVMALNKDSNDPIPLRVSLTGFSPRSGEQAIVTGPTAGATNEPEDGAPSVTIVNHALADVGDTTVVTLPPHSANAIVFRR